MMTLDPIPQAIIEVVSCECKTYCCIGGVNAIKYNCIAHSPAKRESNTIRNRILEMVESLILKYGHGFLYQRQ